MLWNLLQFKCCLTSYGAPRLKTKTKTIPTWTKYMPKTVKLMAFTFLLFLGKAPVFVRERLLLQRWRCPRTDNTFNSRYWFLIHFSCSYLPAKTWCDSNKQCSHECVHLKFTTQGQSTGKFCSVSHIRYIVCYLAVYHFTSVLRQNQLISLNFTERLCSTLHTCILFSLQRFDWLVTKLRKDFTT